MYQRYTWQSARALNIILDFITQRVTELIIQDLNI